MLTIIHHLLLKKEFYRESEYRKATAKLKQRKKVKRSISVNEIENTFEILNDSIKILPVI